jgi:hypothetical protein
MYRVIKLQASISVIVTMLSVSSFSLKGQQVTTGMYGGVTASQVSGDYYTGFNKIGWTVGFFMNRPIAYNIHWQAELKYGTRGVYKGPSDADLTLYKSSYHILELPLSVHYLYDDKILAELGISPELLVTTFFWDENGLLDRSTYPENRRFGLNVFAGVGYWINERIMAGIRYTNSAVPFRDPAEWNHPQYRGYFHNIISLSMAYRFKGERSGT